MFEKSVTFIGNLVAIITFFISVLNWFGMTLVVDASIPNSRVASAILIGFCFFASYGEAQLLSSQAKRNANILILWFMLTFSYAFGFLFLLDKSSTALQLNAESKYLAMSSATLCNTVLFLGLFSMPRMYPSGFSLVEHLFNSSGQRASHGCAVFGHYLSLTILFLFLRSK
jgi:hypothetical protein